MIPLCMLHLGSTCSWLVPRYIPHLGSKISVHTVTLIEQLLFGGIDGGGVFVLRGGLG